MLAVRSRSRSPHLSASLCCLSVSRSSARVSRRSNAPRARTVRRNGTLRRRTKHKMGEPAPAHTRRSPRPSGVCERLRAGWIASRPRVRVHGSSARNVVGTGTRRRVLVVETDSSRRYIARRSLTLVRANGRRPACLASACVHDSLSLTRAQRSVLLLRWEESGAASDPVAATGDRRSTTRSVILV